MEQLYASIIVAIVEGVTEFLPVSSTGHMILVGHMLGFDDEAATVFEVFIQLGAILSVIYIYRNKFTHFLSKDGWDTQKGLSVWHVAAGIIPVMGIGYLLHGLIKKYLFSPQTVIVGLILGGIMMLVAEKFSKKQPLEDIDKMTIKQAMWVGLFQIFSLWPGFSRSGSTISGGLFMGLSRKASAEFTFIIAVPLMFVACIYDLLKNWSVLTFDNLMMLGIGFFVAFITAWISVVWFLKFLNRSSLAAFAYYRFLLAIFSFWYFR